MKITVERLRNLLAYDAVTGEFRWLVDRQRARRGELAGTICPMYGYRLVGIDYRHYRANRLAFLYMTGEWPSGQVDHIDRDRANDAWANLRPASTKQNQENRSVSPQSKSGVAGVSWQPKRQKWMAHITHHGKTKNLGRFSNVADAIAVRKAAERTLFTHAT